MIRYTLISNSLTDVPGGRPRPLSKSFRLSDDGMLVKTTAAQLVTGRAQLRESSSIRDFVHQVGQLQPHQALAYGVTEESDVDIATRDQLRKLRAGGNHRSHVARDRQHFRFAAGPAIWFIDYDPSPKTAPLTAHELRAKLLEACPELISAPIAAIASASTHIYHGTRELRGAGGIHMYVAVADGTDIPRAGAALYERLWGHGSGYFVVSKSGQVLDRNLIDRCVWQPERLDFASGAHCSHPLERRRPDPDVWNAEGSPFDTRILRGPTTEECDLIHNRRAEARAAVEPSRRQIRGTWVSERTKALEARGIEIITAQRTAEYAADHSMLLGDFELLTEDGRIVTVADLLADRHKFHSCRFADPLDPTYRDDRRIAQANLLGGGRPTIFSFAHGGCRYVLCPQSRTLKLTGSKLPDLADEVLRTMTELGDVFDQPVGGGCYQMVHINEGYMIPVTYAWLRTHVGRIFRCERFIRGKEWVPVDVPKDLIEAIMGDVANRGLPKLRAVIREPTIRPDGTILDQPGYSERDCLLFESDDVDPPRIPERPTDPEIRDAFVRLYHPFAGFPFVSDGSRAVLVAAALTTACRAMIETSPGIAFDAPTAASGKTLLARCIAYLSGMHPPIEPPPATDDEAAKRFLAALRAGASIVLWDNLTTPVYGNGALCAFVTAPMYTGRVLGVTQMASYQNRAMLLITGNNMKIEGDACRRILQCRIDSETERPGMRTFDLAPASYVRDHRREMRLAALTILRGFVSRGAPKQTGDTAGSFEEWDFLVRQCVIWLGRSGLATVGLGDPYESALISMDIDPTAEVVRDVMRAWRKDVGDAWLTAGEVLQRADFGSLREAIDAISTDVNFNAVRFGLWLQKHLGRVIDELRIDAKRDASTKSWRYAVRPVRRRPDADPAHFEDLSADTRGILDSNPSLADLL